MKNFKNKKSSILILLALVTAAKPIFANNSAAAIPSQADSSAVAENKVPITLNNKNGLLSADLKSVSIKDIFEELKKLTGISYEIEKEIQAQTVTISFENKELIKGIEDILNTIGNPSYMLTYKKDKDGKDEIAGINITKRGSISPDLSVGKKETSNLPVVAKLLDFAKDKSKDKFERISAIGKLGKMKARDCRKDFEELLKKDDDGDVRMVAAIGLGLIGDKESIPALKESLKDKEPKVRLRAAYMLGKMKDDSGYDLAKETMKDNEDINREYAVEALGIIGKDESKPLIEEAKKDKNVWVQIKANIAEKNIEVVKLSEPERTIFLKNILNKEKQIQMQIWAANSLVEIGDSGIEGLREIIKKNEDGAYVAQKQLALNDIK